MSRSLWPKGSVRAATDPVFRPSIVRCVTKGLVRWETWDNPRKSRLIFQLTGEVDLWKMGQRDDLMVGGGRPSPVPPETLPAGPYGRD
jgi:hypothetical protein